MAGKVLGDGGHAGLAHARHVGHRQCRDAVRITVKGPIADDLADAVIEVDAGGKAEVHPHRPQLARHQPAHGLGQGQSFPAILVVAPAQSPRRRQSRKAFAEALYASAFMIHGDQQVRTSHTSDGARQRTELGHVAIVAAEQDHAAHQRMGEHPKILQASTRCRRCRP